jgi:hypothetical protein
MRELSLLPKVERDTTVLRWAIAAFIVWLAWTGPVRASGSAALPAWLLGRAPNFFAGVTLSFWQAFAVPGRVLGSCLLALVVLTVGEVVQLAMPQHRSDPGDVVASALGCAAAATALTWRRRVTSRGPRRLHPAGRGGRHDRPRRDPGARPS